MSLVPFAPVSRSKACQNTASAEDVCAVVRKKARPSATSSRYRMAPRSPSAHQPVAVCPADRLALREAGQPERGQIGVAGGPLGDQRGHHVADGGRELEPVTGE